MNALAEKRVSDYVNENFASTYLKVGTFQVVNGQKQGGNVATYFCLADGSVLHAIAGKVNADQFLTEARWAYEVRKSALAFSTNLGGIKTVDARKYREKISAAHKERYTAAGGNRWNGALPARLPQGINAQTQVHWLLATRPMAKIDDIYPVVWEQILKEKLSTLPVEKQ